MPNTRTTHIKSGATADFKLEYDTIYVYDEINNQLTTVATLGDVQANQYVFFGTKSDRRIDAAEKNLSLLIHKLEQLTTDDIPQGSTNTYLLNNGVSSQAVAVDAVNLDASGSKIFKQFASNRLEFKTVKAASGVTLTEDATSVTVGLDANANANSSSWTAKINFDGGGDPTTVEDLPAGVTANVSGSAITFTHGYARSVKSVVYMGYDANTDEYRMRFPTSTYIVKTTPATLTTEFTINVNTAATGADANGHALMNVVM
tara:strand:+ start:1619 stop:2398 length:780 start_codon:yes stop_codon:yes gene_type:complete